MSTGYQKALHTALRILTRRDHSIAELNGKLRLRGVEEKVIEKVLAECRRLNYLDDNRFAAGLIRHLKRKGCGSLRLRNEFHQRGLLGVESEKLLRKAFGAGEELQIACEVAEKKLKSVGFLEPHKCREKIYRFLSSRGFSNAVIAEALRKVVNSFED
jgi:regulatory protein